MEQGLLQTALHHTDLVRIIRHVAVRLTVSNSAATETGYR